MGYYSNFTLQIKADQTGRPGDWWEEAWASRSPERVLLELFKAENEYAAYCLDDNGEPLQEGKWYDAAEELRAFSAKHPDALFKLHVVGEEAELDQWVYYAQAGAGYRVDRERWVPPPFNPKLLKAAR